jgi:23S rRNA-/tRNA-specific pseudouridylate synthase
MIRDVRFETGDAEAGQRLDQTLLARFPSSSRAFCRQAVEAGDVRVSGRPGQKGLKLKAGETVEVHCLKEAGDQCVRHDASVVPDIVFADEALIAVNKPVGMPVHP